MIIQSRQFEFFWRCSRGRVLRALSQAKGCAAMAASGVTPLAKYKLVFLGVRTFRRARASCSCTRRELRRFRPGPRAQPSIHRSRRAARESWRRVTHRRNASFVPRTISPSSPPLRTSTCLPPPPRCSPAVSSSAFSDPARLRPKNHQRAHDRINPSARPASSRGSCTTSSTRRTKRPSGSTS